MPIIKELSPVNFFSGISSSTFLNFSISRRKCSLPDTPPPTIMVLILYFSIDFSFSGLKTAVLYLIRDIEKSRKLDSETKSEIALEFENAAIECLIYKTKKAIEKYKIKTIIVGGGVSGNEHLRREIEKFKKVELLIPEKKFTGDNSLMIGIAGYIQYLKRKRKFTKASNIKATGNLSL